MEITRIIWKPNVGIFGTGTTGLPVHEILDE